MKIKEKPTAIKLVAALLSLLMISSVLPFFPITASAAEGDVYYLYCDANGENWQTGTKVIDEYTLVTSDNTSWLSGWYVVQGDVTIKSSIAVNGDVHLILEDSCKFTVNGSISGGNLSIYAQSKGDDMGMLSVKNICCGAQGLRNYDGSNGGDGGNVDICGGVIKLSGSIANGGDGGSGDSYSGMGGTGGKGGDINIYNGDVDISVNISNGGAGGDGYYGGYGGSGGTVNITGGTVTVGGDVSKGGDGDSAKSGGDGGNGGSVNVSGGSVEAAGIADGGAGGSGDYTSGGKGGTGGTVNITGGSVTAKSIANGNDGSSGRYYGSDGGDGGKVTVTCGSVIVSGILANGGTGSSGSDSGGNGGKGGTVVIEGGTVKGGVFAKGGTNSSGGVNTVGTVIINAGTVTSVGSDNANGFSAVPTLNIYKNWKVSVGDSESELAFVLKSDLTDAAYTDNKAVKIEICQPHETDSYKYIDQNNHSGACKWCGTEFEENHNTDENGVCICGGFEVKYLDEYGNKQTAICRAKITADNISSYTTINSGWYAVKDEITANSRITVSGEVHLVLEDNCNLTVNGGITVNDNDNDVTNLSSNALTIYAQSTDESTMGRLTANNSISGQWGAGIGSTNYNGAGKITINGGIIEASGGCQSAGIGGASGGGCGTITINGGIITATAGSEDIGGNAGGAGIGCGNSGTGGTICINGGTVDAKGAGKGSGIGSGENYPDTSFVSNITINGGNVTAAGGENAAGIGCGSNGSVSNITISGGKVTATGGSLAAGIGSGSYGSVDNITVSGGTVIAKGGDNADGIGDGYSGNDSVFSTSTAGNAVIFASSISDRSGKNKWSGVIFEGNKGSVYGSSVTPTENFTIDSGKNLLIPEGSTLEIKSITAANNGNVYVDGTLDGTLNGGSIYYHLTVNGGIADGDASTYTFYIGKNYSKAGGNITLTADASVGQKENGWTTSDSTVTVTDNAFTMPAKVLTVNAEYVNAPTYTVTIPAEVKISEALTISAQSVNIVSGSQFIVKLSETSENDNAFKLKTTDGAELEYTVTKGGSDVIKVGDTVLTVEGGIADNSGSAELSFVPAEKPKYSGEYTGTVTFTVSVL